MHVLGAVRRSGVVRLPIGSRVADAIARAGGIVGGAKLGRLNLAQPLGDGQQVFVARRGDPGSSEVRDPVSTAPTGAGGRAGSAVGSPSASGSPAGAPVDLNTATEADLDALPGVGPVTAGKIIAWRTAHGRFSAVAELQEVDGIGPKTFAELAPHVTVG
ncbi:comEA protein [Friedmanniella endophytica]|uniref:ComEA protein n=1 Tax=Microlunatus kandeliicorticis TaxID=1759536 RepID=A0A7W3IV55_9ACTN|nr:helix-hairpin-helix domain-containing protein [Microlunatus kandeliicorticis]MBA8795863.1 comEA protein [Microlunatus kandeliicorticis]